MHHVLKDLEENAKEKFHYIKGEGKKLSANAAKSVNTYAHKKPWHMIGISTALAAFFGFILGRKGNHRRNNHSRRR